MRNIIDRLTRSPVHGRVDGQQTGSAPNVNSSQLADLGATHSEDQHAGIGAEQVNNTKKQFHGNLLVGLGGRFAAMSEPVSNARMREATDRIPHAERVAKKAGEIIEEAQSKVSVAPIVRFLKWGVTAVVALADSIGLSSALAYVGDQPLYAMVLTVGFGLSVTTLGVSLGYAVLQLSARDVREGAASQAVDGEAGAAPGAAEGPGTDADSADETAFSNVIARHGLFAAVGLGTIAAFTTMLLRFGTTLPITVILGLGVLTFLSALVCFATTVVFHDAAADRINAQRRQQRKADRFAARPTLSPFLWAFEFWKTLVDNKAAKYIAKATGRVAQVSVGQNAVLINSADIVGIGQGSRHPNRTATVEDRDGSRPNDRTNHGEPMNTIDLFPHHPGLNPLAPSWNIEDWSADATSTRRTSRRAHTEATQRNGDATGDHATESGGNGHTPTLDIRDAVARAVGPFTPAPNGNH